MNKSDIAIPAIEDEILSVDPDTKAHELRTGNELPVTTRRTWKHGSTQMSDDMYLGGLMCQ